MVSQTSERKQNFCPTRRSQLEKLQRQKPGTFFFKANCTVQVQCLYGAEAVKTVKNKKCDHAPQTQPIITKVVVRMRMNGNNNLMPELLCILCL